MGTPRGRLGWGPCLGISSLPRHPPSCFVLFGSQLSQDPALSSLLAHPLVFSNSQEGETHSSKVNLVTGSGRRAAVRFLNQVNLGNPNSST